jgi:hypothetical protein
LVLVKLVQLFFESGVLFERLSELSFEGFVSLLA